MARARRSGGRRADYTWILGTGHVNGLSTTQAFDSMTTVLRSSTLVRTRGEIHVGMDPGAIDDTMVVGVGLIVATDQAIAAGAASLPSPIDDGDADWLWHGLFGLHAATIVSGDDWIGQSSRREIDSKAMRKVKQNDNLVVVYDSSVLAGSPTADVVIGARFLLAD